MKPAQRARPRDSVDAILEQWARERPDLDVSPMGPIGRLKRCASLLEPRIEDTFTQFGLSLWEFDMLATLRRSGEPYKLTPTELFSSLMVTSGTMTHRLKLLETRGLIRRVPNELDARSMFVQLTNKGLKLVDPAVDAHVDNEHRILAPLPEALVVDLNRCLSALLTALEHMDSADGREVSTSVAARPSKPKARSR